MAPGRGKGAFVNVFLKMSHYGKYYFFFICELGLYISEIISWNQAKILIQLLVLAKRPDAHVTCEQGKKHLFKEGYF